MNRLRQLQAASRKAHAQYRYAMCQGLTGAALAAFEIASADASRALLEELNRPDVR